MMYPLKKLDSPTANELAEAILLQQDIRSSLATMKLWAKRYSKQDALSEDDLIISQGLFRDAVCQFIGCFDKRAEYALSPADVYQAVDGGQAYFKWLKDIRDAYVAHKFGPLRQCVAGVLVDTSGPGVLGVGHMFHIYTGPKEDVGPSLLQFMSIASRHIDEKVKALEERIAKEARQMTLAELDALPTARTYGVDPSEVRMSRERFHKSRTTRPPKTKHSSS